MKLLITFVLASLLSLAPILRGQTYTFTSAASIYSPGAVALDASGNYYSTGFYNFIVNKSTADGATTVFAGTSYQQGGDDGTGSAARFHYPRGLVLDTAGNLLVADSGNHTIRKITPAGVVSTFAGVAGEAGHADGSGTKARFDTPQGLAIDSSGNLFVADSKNHTIRKITPAGVVSTVAGSPGAQGTTNGTGANARFNQPQGVAVDSGGNLYVADSGNNAIRKITAQGTVSTLAGLPGNRGNADGIGSAARFDNTQGIAVDSSGNVFVADTGNCTVRKITPAGTVTTIGGTAGYGGDANGIGASARFYNLRGIAIDRTGTLYIADAYAIRLGLSSSQPVITVQPQGRSVASGSSFALSVSATGGEPLSYQWRKNGAAITGATSPMLLLPNIKVGDSGTYSVSVTNSYATIISSNASITVLAPLANDNLANAQTLTGNSGAVTGNNNGATGEIGEPTHADLSGADRQAVWYRWTPTQSGTAVLDSSNGAGAFMAAYTGTNITDLTLINKTSTYRLSFTATAGVTYLIATGRFPVTNQGNFNLNWRLIPNDNFAQAQVLTADNGQVAGNNAGATGEPSEPAHGGGNSAAATSVWYRWTPTQSGNATIDTLGTKFSTGLAIYTGSDVASLNLVAQDSNSINYTASRVIFSAVAGTTYSIAVGGYWGGNGDLQLNWQTTQVPIITGQPAAQTVKAGASVSFSVAAISHLTPRYQWQRDGVAIAGATDATLTLSNVQAADAGAYSVLVSAGAYSASSGAVKLTVLIPPANDNFAAAETLTGLTGSTTGTNVNATAEEGEPVHWSIQSTASAVWYRWTAPASGLVAIDTVGSNFDTVLAVYTGASFGSLTRLTQDDDSGGGRTSQVTFAATGGKTYYIAVGGNYGVRGSIKLTWQLSAVLAIATNPINQTIAVGGSATFSVDATGENLTYQWHRNGEKIPGATTATLTIGNIQGGADASYTVTVTNSTGSVTSSPATLAVSAPALTTLSINHTRAGSNMLWSIAAGDGQMVAVGGGGIILSSPDGTNWTPRDSGTTYWIVGVTYAAGQFVAVADHGLILTSRDGITWKPVAVSGTTERLNNVIYAAGKFVVVGEGGTILTSTDAQTWTPRASGVKTWLHGLAYNERIGHFATCGEGGVFLYSADGAQWNRLPIPGVTEYLEGVAAVNSYADFVVIGHNSLCLSIRQNQLVLKTGEKLVTWSAEKKPMSVTAGAGSGIIAGAGALFAIGPNGAIVTATNDQGPWYALPSGTNAYLAGGLFYNDRLYLVGDNETVIQSELIYPSRMINISTRGQVGVGANALISGFVVTGNEPKQVLLRAAGPALAAIGLNGTLAAPVLTLFDSASQQLATSTGWSSATNATAIATVTSRVGAFPFAANSGDSALLVTLQPGLYTAHVTGRNDTTGLSIVEVYDADALASQGARAINISTRGQVGSGQDKLIAGFVVSGASSRRLLIRAVGPTLGKLGLPGTLAEPRLELYNSSNLLHSSANAWTRQPNADDIRSAAAAVKAFDLSEDSKDAAMIVTLLPGAWTVQVSGVNDTTGVALVEVYDLP